jgi:hypothetical protein
MKKAAVARIAELCALQNIAAMAVEHAADGMDDARAILAGQRQDTVRLLHLEVPHLGRDMRGMSVGHGLRPLAWLAVERRGEAGRDGDRCAGEVDRPFARVKPGLFDRLVALRPAQGNDAVDGRTEGCGGDLTDRLAVG